MLAQSRKLSKVRAALLQSLVKPKAVEKTQPSHKAEWKNEENFPSSQISKLNLETSALKERIQSIMDERDNLIVQNEALRIDNNYLLQENRRLEDIIPPQHLLSTKRLTSRQMSDRFDNQIFAPLLEDNPRGIPQLDNPTKMLPGSEVEVIPPPIMALPISEAEDPNDNLSDTLTSSETKSKKKKKKKVKKTKSCLPSIPENVNNLQTEIKSQVSEVGPPIPLVMPPVKREEQFLQSEIEAVNFERWLNQQRSAAEKIRKPDFIDDIVRTHAGAVAESGQTRFRPSESKDKTPQWFQDMISRIPKSRRKGFIDYLNKTMSAKDPPIL